MIIGLYTEKITNFYNGHDLRKYSLIVLMVIVNNLSQITVSVV